jgi:hypothetical protein
MLQPVKYSSMDCRSREWYFIDHQICTGTSLIANENVMQGTTDIQTRASRESLQA